jgi:hypothetical protein
LSACDLIEKWDKIRRLQGTTLSAVVVLQKATAYGVPFLGTGQHLSQHRDRWSCKEIAVKLKVVVHDADGADSGLTQ